ncbi:MAG TPA: hypothetical protein VLU94_03145 [Candidatus Nitrosotalea sp.]|nr:hypothetical protein [Candidatus Nitrosotalea sp.]
MNPLPAIPTPAAQRWREFRIRLLPVLIFAATAAVLALMWQRYVAPPSLVGQVEPVVTYVTSPKPGTLAQLNVSRMQRVKAGEVIAQVVTTDPKVLASSLAVIQAEIQLLRINLAPIIAQQRYGIQYDRMEVDWLDQKVQLATDRVKLQLAENDFRRNEELFKDKIVSDKVFDQARTLRDKLQIQVDERTKLIAEMERNIQMLRLRDESESTHEKPSDPHEVLRASIAVQEEKLRLTEAELSPVVLRIPMDGIVSVVNHRSGEAIIAGEPIVTIGALTGQRIVGYFRPPFTVEPVVGMNVEVHARSLNRPVTHAKILEVGTQMEQIQPVILPPSNDRTPVLGLPVIISLPPESKLLPGEVVDLVIR